MYPNFQAKGLLPDNYGELGCYPTILNQCEKHDQKNKNI